jgi:hypothetical protein
MKKKTAGTFRRFIIKLEIPGFFILLAEAGEIAIG